MGYTVKRYTKYCIYALIGMLVSAKIFGCLSGVYRDIGMHRKLSVDSLTKTGIVYLGGLFGFLETYRYYCCSEEDRETLNLLSVFIPLFHCISRVGCFFAGCCYGTEYNGLFHVTYRTLIGETVNTANRLPVQLVEAIFELAIFAYLFILLNCSDWQKKYLLMKYLSIYSVGRFFIEYLRGDSYRGVISNISFSQVLCICIWIAICFFRIKRGYTMEEN